MLRTKLVFGIIAVHFFMIISINTYHLLNDYKSIYPTAAEEESSFFKKTLSRIIVSDVYTMVSTYTGSNSSYGFYAPSVGSEFMMSFKVLDSNNNIIGMKTQPDFVMSESKMRFNLCTMVVQDMILDTASIARPYTKLMMHQISDHIRQKFDGGEAVIADIYVYNYPSTEEYLNRKEPRMVSEVARYKFDVFN